MTPLFLPQRDTPETAPTCTRCGGPFASVLRVTGVWHVLPGRVYERCTPADSPSSVTSTDPHFWPEPTE